MTVQHVAVPNGAIPPIPPGATATVHSRELPQQPQAPAQAPAPAPTGGNPLDGLVLPGQQPQQPQAQQPNLEQPQPAQPQGIDPQLLQLLAGLTNAQQQPQAQTPAAPVPVPAASPASGLEGALRGVLSNAGVDVDRAIKNAIEHGDTNLIDVAYLTEKGGANAAHLISVAQAVVTNVTEAENRQKAQLYARAGGEANFHAAVQSFNRSAPEQVKMIVKALTDSDNDQQVLAGVDLLLQYSQGSTIQPAGLVQAGAGATIAAGLSREGFQAELQKLDRNGPQYESQRQELFARRAFGKHNGL